MSAEARTCDPPAKHSNRQWHWLRHSGDCRWYVAECRNGRLWNGPGSLNSREIYKQGWRYVGPASPPTFNPKTNSYRIPAP